MPAHRWHLPWPINSSAASSRCVLGICRTDPIDAFAFVSLSLSPRRDWWLLKGLALYLTSLYTRRAFGNNEYRYNLNQVEKRISDWTGDSHSRFVGHARRHSIRTRGESHSTRFRADQDGIGPQQREQSSRIDDVFALSRSLQFHRYYIAIRSSPIV